MNFPRSLLQAITITFLMQLGGCFQQQEPPPPAPNPKMVVPNVAAEGDRKELENFSGNEESPTARPKIPLDSGEKLLFAINVNLDLDTTDEQILVVREKDDPQAPIKIAVVDFDSVRNSYVRTWEAFSRATNLKTFEVALKDLVGDHNLEIVCRGINSEGKLTLDVFRKTASPNGLGLYFVEIFRIESYGSVEIEEIERSEGYHLGQKNGPSFPIVAFTQDTDSENVLDRIKYFYNWQYQQNRYVLTSTEKQPGAVVEEKQLEELFSSTEVEPFEQYLAGPWYLSGSRGEEEILFFLPEERTISIFSGDVQEMYTWLKSFRNLSNRLLIYAENAAIDSINKRFWVEVKSMNMIDLSIIGVERWDRYNGSYIRLSEEVQESLLFKEGQEVTLSDLTLNGLYRSDSGIEIIFEAPNFTWISENGDFFGAYAVIDLDQPVLYLKGLDKNGLPTRDFTFVMDYTEKLERNHLYRTLNLIPGLIGVHGVKTISNESYLFEQFEIIEDDDVEGIVPVTKEALP